MVEVRHERFEAVMMEAACGDDGRGDAGDDGRGDADDDDEDLDDDQLLHEARQDELHQLALIAERAEVIEEL